MLDMHQRKAEMARLADAFIALPGFINSGTSLLPETLMTEFQVQRRRNIFIQEQSLTTTSIESLSHYRRLWHVGGAA